jgi:hypothetical protein
MKKIFYSFVLVNCFGSALSACPTCLAHLKRNDKPFFVRQLSAQIAASQTTVKTIKKDDSPELHTQQTKK